ncbi:CRISPR-associated protein Csx18 [Anabaena sp. UHCC 0399]|uniref:CRISPR-associated protein Csx18 n=1 Tax=Anabaena sp. UHCC 0399 TaxID=3110238 RepID=UPI002B20D4E0|nr:CRISPR-associated protein Csx18 [Anabaena sp. UHCC 0399]MEA5565762.1 CRISPR-associated protein Csx18 [Anabaena sp. UHCC 0399]
MSTSVAKKLIRYRSWIVAVVNAATTWVILIIAPLGLFAVISCTVAVFLGSLLVGEICDRLSFQLLRNLQRDIMEARRETDNLDVGLSSYLDLSTQQEEKRK